MGIRKFEFDEINTELQYSEEEKRRIFDINGSLTINLAVIEIETENINDIFIKITRQVENAEIIHLYKHRGKMLWQNNRYVLCADIKINPAFQLTIQVLPKEKDTKFKGFIIYEILSNEGTIL